jgi:hypothetical protein
VVDGGMYVTLGDLYGWGKHTDNVNVTMFDGGHFFLNDHTDAIADLLASSTHVSRHRDLRRIRNARTKRPKRRVGLHALPDLVVTRNQRHSHDSPSGQCSSSKNTQRRKDTR